MPIRVGLFFVVIFVLVGVGCGVDEQPFVGQFSAPVVYGADDRLEVYNHPDTELRDIARSSLVALIDSEQLELGPDGRYVIFALPLQSSKGLCDGELFLDQPTAATCSGVLIQEDLVLTAGHCARSFADCAGRSFVFNYHLDGPQQIASIEADDVYDCEEIVLRDETTSNSLTPDFAVIRLDRPVAGGHAPVAPRPATTALVVGEPVAMIGFGSGLPAKIDSGAAVADPRTQTLDYFVVNADAFAGHSGSPVFDGNHEFIGHLVAGRAPDYVLDESETCNIVNTFDDSQAGEAIHYFSTIVERLCEAGIADESLCGETSCSGEPCGAKAPPAGPGSGNGPVPPAANTGGCQASGPGGSAGFGPLGSALLVFLVLGWVRRSAV